MKTSESIKSIAAALVKSQSEMGNAVKDSKNPFFKSNYADLNSIREASLPILNKNGITVLQPTTVVDGRAYVETTLLHESGEFLSSLTEIIYNKSNDAQSAGSGISYARRYGLQSFLCIGAEDDDANAASGKGSSEPAKAPLRASGFKAAPAAAPELAKEEPKPDSAPADSAAPARRGSFGRP